MSSSSGERVTGSKLNAGRKLPNLTRIRENQRRSRARHKEYVQELEEKYRACQQAGSEASMEVQAAARAVLEENQRLRALLQQQGLLQQASGGESPPALLRELLTSKRPCCDDSEQKAMTFIAVSPPASGPPQKTDVPSSAAPKPSTRSPGPAANFSPNAPYGMPWILPSAPDTCTASEVTDERSKTSMVQSPLTMTCSNAAAVIRGSFPHVDDELEQDMNCSGNSARCSVPNTRVFELLDRYGSG